MKRLAPSEMPDWPRRMGARLAAAYIGISEAKLLDGVKAGRYPPPQADGANQLWDRKALDRYVDGGGRTGDDPITRRIREVADGDGKGEARQHRAA